MSASEPPHHKAKKPRKHLPSGLERGGYLLFHFRSIIGVVRFNFSVRNGKRWSPHAMATLVSSGTYAPLNLGKALSEA